MLRVVNIILFAAMGLMAQNVQSQERVKLKVSPLVRISSPILTDSTDINDKPFDFTKQQLQTPLSLALWKEGEMLTDSVLAAPAYDALRVMGFQLDARLFAKVKIHVDGLKDYAVYINGKEASEKGLTPGRHEVAIKFLQKKDETDTLHVKVESSQKQYLTLNPEGDKPYQLEDYLHGTRAGRTSLSASGKFLKYSFTTTRVGGKSTTTQGIKDLKTGNEYACENFLQWARDNDQYVSVTLGKDGEKIYEYVDVLSGNKTPIFTDYTASYGQLLPGEQMLLINQRNEGPKEDPQIYEILEPDDRLKGWRNRNNVSILDFASQTVQPLTMGQHNVYATPSPDGRQVVIWITENDITQRPFSFTSLLLLDRETMKVDTLVSHDGFLGSVKWAPDMQSLYISGSPEAFGGIGINDPTGKTPSMIQTELFEMKLSDKSVRSLTKNFNPNIKSFEVSSDNSTLYALCENRDRQDIFRLHLPSGKWSQLPLSENVISSFSLSSKKAILSYTGQSESNSDRIYTMDLKNDKETLVFDVDATRMKGIKLGTCSDWNFQSNRGDTIYGRFYLPPDFDEKEHYPMLVYYYGGCSPVGRSLDSYYNFHGWAAMGYVVYVIQPSGCTGFGQEFAARHVNAYGEYTAADIIEGTKKFCETHPFVKKDKVGCLGASYGGFMTMYLQTVTDIFAAAMAHAGISNPASYWGYGNWGYSYNAISAADSYPWNNPELMSLRSPLFNADKVHTPILFLHGAVDTNVPIIESTQMFNALKILGRECAFVTVEGQDHHILDYDKRIKWVYTFYAWFAKWLQDDPTWWDTLYPPKNIK